MARPLTLAGVFALPDAMHLVARRGRLMPLVAAVACPHPPQLLVRPDTEDRDLVLRDQVTRLFIFDHSIEILNPRRTNGFPPLAQRAIRYYDDAGGRERRQRPGLRAVAEHDGHQEDGHARAVRGAVEPMLGSIGKQKFTKALVLSGGASVVEVDVAHAPRAGPSRRSFRT